MVWYNVPRANGIKSLKIASNDAGSQFATEAELESSPPKHLSRFQMALNSQPPKDHWTKEAYTASASFVPELTSKVVSWLDPQPTDAILDLGCGEGLLTARIKERCASVAAFDSSNNLIESARNAYGSIPGLSWHLQDCRYLEECKFVNDNTYTKVFSNAALHWILRDATTMASVFRAVFRALKPGGKLVFEMGGAGNVSEVHAALLAAVVHQGVSIEQAREASPWFFPSEQLMQKDTERGRLYGGEVRTGV